MAKEFSAAVADWAKQTEVTQAEVLQESLRQLSAETYDNTPVVTGNTRNSIELSTLGPIKIDWRTKKFRDPSDAINNAAAGVAVGQTSWVGYRAPWAHKLEPKYAMLRLAAQRWGQIVNEVALKFRGG